MSEHAKLSPSSFHSHYMCRAKYRLERPFKEGAIEESNIHADTGTAAHELLEESLKNFEFGHMVFEKIAVEAKLKKPAFKASNGIELTKEETDHVKDVYDWIVKYVKKNINADLSKVELVAELQVNPMIYDDATQESLCHGTADIVIFDYFTQKLYIFDLKFGMKPVTVVENTQLILYAMGGIKHFEVQGESVKDVTMGILQPRLFVEEDQYNTWTVDRDNIMDRWDEYNKVANEVISQANTKATAGVSQCHYCKVAACRVKADFSLTQARATFKKIETTRDNDIKTNLSDPESLNDNELRLVLDNANLITGWIKSCQELTKQRGKDGDSVPGYKLVAGKASRSWVSDDDIIDFIDDKDVAFETKLRSVAQVEKLFKSEKRNIKDLDAFIKRKIGGDLLVKDSDKRKALNYGAKNVFKKIDKPVEPIVEKPIDNDLEDWLN